MKRVFENYVSSFASKKLRERPSSYTRAARIQLNGFVRSKTTRVRKIKVWSMNLFSDYRFPMRKIENVQEMYIVGVSGYNMF